MAAKIFSITGPSGVGKGYVKSAIKANFDVHEVPVYTTRPPRRQEEQGSRIFVSQYEFETMFRKGQFGFVNDIFRNRYGFALDDLQKLYASDARFVLEMYVDNVEKFRSMFPTARMVAMRSGSAELISEHLSIRGDVSEEALERLEMMEYENGRIAEMAGIFDRVYNITPENQKSSAYDILDYAGMLFLPHIVGIMGPSCSGKTTVCERLANELGAEHVSSDDFFVNREEYPIYDGFINMDSPDSVKWDMLSATLRSLSQGKPSAVPIYDKEESRIVGERIAQPHDVVISEGFVLFHNPDVRQLIDTRIYLNLSMETQKRRRMERGLHSDAEYFDRVIVPMYEQYGIPASFHADHFIDAEKSVEEVVGEVREIIKSRGVVSGS